MDPESEYNYYVGEQLLCVVLLVSFMSLRVWYLARGIRYANSNFFFLGLTYEIVRWVVASLVFLTTSMSE